MLGLPSFDMINFVAQDIQLKNYQQQTALVFATHKFMGQKGLTDMDIAFFKLSYTIRG